MNSIESIFKTLYRVHKTSLLITLLSFQHIVMFFWTNITFLQCEAAFAYVFIFTITVPVLLHPLLQEQQVQYLRTVIVTADIHRGLHSPAQKTCVPWTIRV